MIAYDLTLEKFGYSYESLSKGSPKLVILVCDYCGKIYEKRKYNMSYDISYTQKDCCIECKPKKIRETSIAKYGVENPAQHNTKHSLNKYFFDIIDTEEKAYWLGFIAADGCIYNHKLSFTLGIQDQEQLNKFKLSLQSSHPIRVIPPNPPKSPNPECSLQISSKYMIQSLNKLNIYSRKSLNCNPDVEQVPLSLLRHYWRGVIDGDGAICNMKNRKTWYISLVGSYETINAFIEYVTTLGIKYKPPRKTKNIYAISYSGVALPQLIVKTLYDNAQIYLDRKYLLAQELLKQIPKQPKYSMFLQDRR